MAYQQTLYTIVKDYIKPQVIKKNNRYAKWVYGYNKEYDLIVISKTGKIGEIYLIGDLHIALPKNEDAKDLGENKWVASEYPKELSKIKSEADWGKYPNAFQEKWHPYIDTEFERREKGYWFINKNIPTYITGTHYMYLQWSKIDVGLPDFRESNRLFYLFWEACKADSRSYGICYLKNRRSGFSFMSSGETVNEATISSERDSAYYLSPVRMRRKCLRIKLYRSRSIIHSFLNQYKTVWTVPKQNWHIEYPLPNLREGN